MLKSGDSNADSLIDEVSDESDRDDDQEVTNTLVAEANVD